jgi:hypothetical protein
VGEAGQAMTGATAATSSGPISLHNLLLKKEMKKNKIFPFLLLTNPFSMVILLRVTLKAAKAAFFMR